MNNKWSMIAIIAILLVSIFNHICYIYNTNVIDDEKKNIVSKETGEPIDKNVDLNKIETRVIINKVISFLCSVAGIVFVVNRHKRKERQWEYFLISGIMIIGTITMLLL